MQFSFDSDNLYILTAQDPTLFSNKMLKIRPNKGNVSKHASQWTRKPILVLRTCLCQIPHLEDFTILLGNYFKILSFSSCTSKKQ